MMNPASRSNNSQVTNIGITSPLGKAKKNLLSRLREATATVYGALRVPRYRRYYIISRVFSQSPCGNLS